MGSPWEAPGKPLGSPWEALCWTVGLGQPSSRLHLLLHALQGQSVGMIPYATDMICGFIVLIPLIPVKTQDTQVNTAQHFAPTLVWCRETPDTPDKEHRNVLAGFAFVNFISPLVAWQIFEKNNTQNTWLKHFPVSCSKMWIQSGISSRSHAQPSFTIS